MIYLSLKDRIEKNNVTNIIRELKIKGKIYDESKPEDDSFENLKKSKLVICDLNIENIKDYLSMKKTVIVYKKNNAKLSDDDNNILYDKHVYTFSRKNELREILSFKIKQKTVKRRIIGSILFVTMLLTIISVITFLVPKEKKEDKNKKVVKIEEKESKKEIDYRYENIVLYGDSITDFYNVQTFYGDLPVVNSGTSGFQTKDLLKLVESRVYVYNPTKVFIMIGTNDIAFTDLTNEEIVENIQLLIDMIKENRPKTKIYIESIYPVNRNTEGNDIVSASMVNIRENTRIRDINKMIKKMCKEEKVGYINMYDDLSDENGDLILDYTIDGLHMSENGYKVITKKLMEYIDPSTKEEKVEKK